MPKKKDETPKDMPKSKKKVVPPPVVEEAPPPVEEKKVKKPYPTIDERITLAEKSIEHWEKLIQERRDLIAVTEKKLKARQESLTKGEIELERAIEKKDVLIRRRDGLDVKSDSKKQYYELMAALKASGKSVEDLIAQLKGA